ncbi:hypothetical protein FOA52_000930 [Chlamydomonas sp. UWO 241]|nr:hypothetical protein FOA52_000930 [Chlamydomonas sp. UWO 241]
MPPSSAAVVPIYDGSPPELDDGKPVSVAPRPHSYKWLLIGLVVTLVALAIILPTCIILTRGDNVDKSTAQAEAIALSGGAVRVVISIPASGTYSEVLALGDGYCSQLVRDGVFTSCDVTVESAASRRRLQESNAYFIYIDGALAAETPDAGVKSVADVFTWMESQTPPVVGVVTVKCAPSYYNADGVCAPCTACTPGMYVSECTGPGDGDRTCAVCPSGKYLTALTGGKCAPCTVAGSYCKSGSMLATTSNLLPCEFHVRNIVHHTWNLLPGKFHVSNNVHHTWHILSCGRSVRYHPLCCWIVLSDHRDPGQVFRRLILSCKRLVRDCMPARWA